MKKQFLALALVMSMAMTGSVSAYWQSAYYQDQQWPDENEGGVTQVVASPFRATANVGNNLSQGKIVQAPVDAARDVTGDAVEGTGKILRGNWF